MVQDLALVYKLFMAGAEGGCQYVSVIRWYNCHNVKFPCLIYFSSMYLWIIFTVEGNSSYYLSKRKIKLLIANLHPIKSEMDSEFSETSRVELSSKNRQQLKAFIFFCCCYKPHPRYLHSAKCRNFTQLPGVEIFWKDTVSA